MSTIGTGFDLASVVTVLNSNTSRKLFQEKVEKSNLQVCKRIWGVWKIYYNMIHLPSTLGIEYFADLWGNTNIKGTTVLDTVLPKGLIYHVDKSDMI